MYSPEIIAERVREITAEVNRTSVCRVHRSVSDRLRSLRAFAR